MSPEAVGMFVFSAGLLWGGLAWSLIRLRKHPDLPEEDVPST